MSDYLELEGCRALVTGGTKGIGEAVAVRLREAGAKVLTTARTTPDDLGPQDLFVAANITTAQGCTAVADAVMEQLGGIDIVIHVVGGSSAPPGGFAVLNDDEWQRALDLNLFPAVRLDRALLPKMLDQGSGVIIHITSIQRQCRCPRLPSRMRRRRRHSPTTAKVCPKRSAQRACASSAFLRVGSRRTERSGSSKTSHVRTTPATKVAARS
jgi:NAD(P)-dependent dehydrogenase (short-subunit alcohol dehydrogenase family)